DEPPTKRVDGFGDGILSHLPLDGRAAMVAECSAVIGAVVDQQGVGEGEAIVGEPAPEEPFGVVGFEGADVAGADDVVADDGPVGQRLRVRVEASASAAYDVEGA